LSDSASVIRKARAEVENLIDDVVRTIEDGVAGPDDGPGFEPDAADALRSRLGDYAAAILDAARRAGRAEGVPAALSPEIADAVDAVVETIRRGVLHAEDAPGFGPAQAEEMRDSLERFGQAIVVAAGRGTRSGIDGPLRRFVYTIRSGVFRVYGRGSYAAITGDQLEAYLETFQDAVLTVVEKER
jgi:hypothetical protein